MPHMTTRIASIALLGLFSAATGSATTTFVNLGTASPPADVDGTPVTAFDLAAQAAIPDFEIVPAISGAPCGLGLMPTVPALLKLSVPFTWETWSHGYHGPVFDNEFASSLVLTLPCPAAAVYLYVEPLEVGEHEVTVTADDGTSSGPIYVPSDHGATGFAFYTDGPGIVALTVDAEASAVGFAVAEFGIAEISVVPTVPRSALAVLLVLLAGVLLLCLLNRRSAISL